MRGRQAIIATTTAALVLLAGSCPAPGADGTVEGTFTILTDPPIVSEFPGGPEEPCEDETGYTFSAEADGDDVSGTITVDASVKEMYQKPGTAEWDQFDFEVLFQDLTYDPDTAGPPTWVYDIEGTIGFQLGISNVPGADEVPEDCTKESLKCTLAAILVVDGELTQDAPLDPIATGATATIEATSDDSNGLPITYLGGEGCGAYSTIVGAHVEVDLDIQF